VNRLFCDFETTGINPYQCEAIEGYFELHNENKEVIAKYNFSSRVNNWSDEAELIHKIDYQDHLLFPKKQDAWEGLISWLAEIGDCIFTCYVNTNTKEGFVLYDYVVLAMESMDHLGINKMSELPFDFSKKESVHTLAKECEKRGFMQALVNPETNRKSYSQEKVYESVFGTKYKSHRAVHDVKAMIKLFYHLQYCKENNIVNRDQMQLL
jgi:hypothetical protein